MRKFNPFNRRFHGRLVGAIVLTLSVAFIHPASAQEAPAELTANGEVATGDSVPAEFVSIHVDGGAMRQVLNSFAMQANRNIVLGPDVTNDLVTIHLNNVQWDNALDVILKPYGYGYQKVGETLVVGELSKMAVQEALEPLQSRVYNLRYLDAGDVKDILQGKKGDPKDNGMLSTRGNMNIITAEGQKGWKDLGQKSQKQNRGSGGSLNMRSREEAEQVRSKTLVVTDVPNVLNKIDEILKQIDLMPQQVLIESKFMEVNADLMRDIGVEISGNFRIDKYPVDVAQEFFNDAPNAFNALSDDLRASAADPSSFGSLNISGSDWNFFIKAIEEDEDTETLSAPKVLTLNNQEAAIVVGIRYPIIETEFDTSSTSAIQSESLEYYESVGIQLNVVPQICADNYIKMVVRPSVTEIIGETGINRYPIIKTRDTETQTLVANGETIAIGGLLEDRETEGVFKVPFLGDIPFLGHLFRRTTKDTKTIDLLIFLTATIVNEDNYDTILEENVRPEEAEEVVEIAVEVEEEDVSADSSADLSSIAQGATEEALAEEETLAEEDLSAIALAKAEALAEEEADSPDVPEDVATILSELE